MPTENLLQNPTAPVRDPDWPVVPGYDITGEVARGGMGVVYVARDLALGRDVAVKTILPHLSADPRLPAQFEREVRLTARLSHPGVAPVHAIGTLPDGRPFLAMRLIGGRTLADLLGGRPDPAHDRGRFVAAFEQVCQAVGYAHSVGVVHRDLKPANVMVGAFGEVQVMDWGLAKNLADRDEPDPLGAGPDAARDVGTGTPPAAGETVPGEPKGSPAYMSPEQARGEWDRVGPRTDVFGLGAILAVILTGEPPYPGDGFLRAIRQAGNVDLTDCFAQLDACGADAELVSLCKRCLSADPVGRPVDGHEVAEAVAAYRAGVEARARKAEADRAAAEAEAREQRKRRKVQLALALAVGLLAAGGAAFAWWDQHRDATQTRIENEKLNAEAARATEETARLKAEAEAARQTVLVQNRITAGRTAIADRLAQTEAGLRAGNSLRVAEPIEEVRRRVKEGNADDYRPRLAAYETELATLQKLDRVDDERWTVTADGHIPSAEKITARLATVFAEYGVVPGTDSVAAGRRIAESIIRERLLRSLEVWFALSGRDPAVGAVLAAADPDEFRNEVRRVGYPSAVMARSLSGRPVPVPAVWVATAYGQDFDLNREARRELLMAACRANPDDFTLLMTLAALDLGTREALRPESARATAGWYRAALALRPANTVAWNNLGNTLRRVKEYKEAKEAYLRVITLDPKNVLAHTNLGITLEELGDRPGSLEMHRQAVALGPNDAGAWTLYAMVLRDADDRPGAAAAAKKAVAADKNYGPAHMITGMLHQEAGEWRAAANAYRDAIRCDPTSPIAPYDLHADSLGKLDDRVGVVRVREEQVRFNPGDADAHNELGLALSAARDWRRAVAAFDEAVRLNPGFAKAWVNRGTALRDSGDPKRAADSFKRAIDVAPEFALAHNSLGLALQDLGNVLGAIKCYEKAILCDPKDGAARSNLGAALLDLDEPRRAKAELEKAVEVDPEYAPAHGNLGLVLRSTGDSPGAIKAYQKALELDPKLVWVWTNLGAAYGASGKYDRAAECAREAIKLDPTDDTAHGLLGIALQELDDIPGARKALTEAARLNRKKWGPVLAKLPPP